MTVIRGATTIEKDCKEEISLSVKELLDEIFRENHLKKEEVRSVIFSLTTDIHSYHPAKAARESGYDFCPLFACTEPDIEGGLKLCIRVMISIEPADGLRDVKHVYLKGAKGLRPRGAAKARLPKFWRTIIIFYTSIRARCTARARWRLCGGG